MLAQVNADATQIATLNTAISKLKAVGQNPNDLLDQRDKLVDELSTLGKYDHNACANGVVTVKFGGVVIVDPSTATGLSRDDADAHDVQPGVSGRTPRWRPASPAAS